TAPPCGSIIKNQINEEVMLLSILISTLCAVFSRQQEVMLQLLYTGRGIFPGVNHERSNILNKTFSGA
ncbi:hypothetical protein, partial [Klebsiella oxytoca]|uniref:hypothetical protein n=1 Tax=Klebsiella oxytoca TaxID=571 RepID=UPI00350EA7DA